MRKVREILRLAVGQGLSQRQVARATSVPVTTVTDHLRRARQAGLGWPLPEGMSDAELEAALFSAPARDPSRPLPDWRYVDSELRKKGVTRELLWLEYKATHPETGYSYAQFSRHYQKWKARLDLPMRQHHRAGEKLFVDFPGQHLPIWDRHSGALSFKAELFVAVLGASNYLFAEAVSGQDLASWIDAHVHAFEFFGAVPGLVVCDNLASGVTRPHRYEPDINATYDEMAAHYGTAIVPARVRKPRDKAKVEAGVLLAERWILAVVRNRRFFSLTEANTVIAELVATINNKPFKKLPGSRRSMFEDLERPAMRLLPALRYEFGAWRIGLKVNIDYHVEFERHYYSVPYQLVGARVDLRATSRGIEVFHSAKRVASHLRSTEAGHHSTDVAHMPEAHRRHAEWTPSRIVAWAAQTGPSTAELAEQIMATRTHPEHGYRACLGIIRLGDKYGTTRLEAAAARALAVRTLTYRSVASILANGLDGQALPVSANRAHPDHPNLRGASYYQ